jgi:hypothetical protein
MKRTRVQKFVLGVVAFGALLALPAVASASSISGTVSGPGAEPIEGVEVCLTPDTYFLEPPPCVVTGLTGQYKVDGLPGGSYLVRFSADRANLRYVSEYYSDKAYNWEADLLTLGPAEDKALDVELAEGGSISGAVTDEGTGLPIAGVSVCAFDHEGIPRRCSTTGLDGGYQLHGLPTGLYNVEYEGGNRINYLREFYEDTETRPTAAAVPVTAPATTSGIDAQLAPGAQILGHVSEVGTGAPLADVYACANGPGAGEQLNCASTDVAGNYALRSMRAGTYFVGFEIEYAPVSGSQIFGQWWRGASSRSEATPITIAPPEARTGIDGQLPRRYESPPQERIQVSLLPIAPQDRPRPPACRRGFQKKRIKGKPRCVRKKRHHRHAHRHHASR